MISGVKAPNEIISTANNLTATRRRKNSTDVKPPTIRHRKKVSKNAFHIECCLKTHPRRAAEQAKNRGAKPGVAWSEKFGNQLSRNPLISHFRQPPKYPGLVHHADKLLEAHVCNGEIVIDR